MNREFKITSEAAIIAIDAILRSNWKPMADAKTPLFVIITSTEEKRRAAQNRYYWKVVIGSITNQAWISGKQFSAEAWHEMMARMFGVQKDVTLPNGEVVLKRLSTSEMKVKEFSEYTEKVTAYGAIDLGIHFPANREEY